MSDKENNKEEKKIRKLSDLDSSLVRKIKEKYQLIKQKCGSHSPGASIVEKEEKSLWTGAMDLRLSEYRTYVENTIQWFTRVP